jgi:Peptidase U49
MMGMSAEEWPVDLPRPVVDPDEYSAERVADEVALVGLGHLLFHELAHVVLGHHPGGDSIGMEQDADNWAADRVLGDPDMDKLVMAKRSLGVALALLLSVAVGIHGGSFGGRTHPRSFDRLFNGLAHRVPANAEVAWAMVVALLGLHMTAKQIAGPSGPFDTFADAVDAMVSVLAEFARRREAGRAR